MSRAKSGGSLAAAPGNGGPIIQANKRPARTREAAFARKELAPSPRGEGLSCTSVILR